MKKIILLIVCLVFLTGCTLDYEINFGRTLINENISATIDGDIYDIASSIDGDGFYLEKEIVDGSLPALKEYKDYYTRKIKVENNISYIDMNYKYNYDNYENSYLLGRCFEKTYVKNTDKYLYVSLGGNFKCFKEDDIRVKVSSLYDVVKHNADIVKDDTYMWDIKMSEDDNNIEFYISKEISEKKEENTLDIKFIVVGSFIVLGIIIFGFRKRIKNS